MGHTKPQFPCFQWRKSEHGDWERDVDECEMFYILSIREGSGCYPVTGCASFTTDSSNNPTINEDNHEKGYRVEDALRKAWMTLCYRHPTLRSRINYDEDSGQWKRVYSILRDMEEEKQWLDSTFKAIDIDVEPLQWFNNDSTYFETSTVFLVRSKEGSQCHQAVFIRCPHDVTDGVGVLQLIDQLFHHAAKAYKEGVSYILRESGNDHARLSPCLRVAAAIPESFSEAQFKRFEDIQTENGEIYNHPGLLGLPPSSVASASGQGKRQRLSLSIPEATTKQILHNCKSIAPGVSVTHVFMAALAQTLCSLQPQKEESYPVRYVNHSMLNLRPYFRNPYDSPEHAAAAYHTVSAQALRIDLAVPSSSSDAKNRDRVDELPQIATKVRDYYKLVRPVSSTDEQIILAPLMFKSLIPPPGSDPHAVSDPPFYPVPLSSIGNVVSIVTADHDPFKLTRVWAASEPIGAGVAIFLGTWDGQIELSAVFDTRYHDAEYIENFLQRIVDCVYEGLRINEHTAPSQAMPVEQGEMYL
ncbi:hypothetical protein F4819DRAFT_424488 [Hypoxylon fuscum]|nr:hypothetical protein F4819DRAFT_424488 [Hypoxylon fuscum]